VPVVTTLVCFFYFAREAAGALGTRHSPAPSCFSRVDRYQTRRGAPRECGVEFSVIPEWCVAPIRNLEIPGSMLRIARNDHRKWLLKFKSETRDRLRAAAAVTTCAQKRLALRLRAVALHGRRKALKDAVFKTR